MSPPFTPGPWRVGKAGPNLCPTVGTHGGLMVAMVTYGSDHPTAANATLIAAAPELYALLDCVVRESEEFIRPKIETLEKAEAALAKVRGEAA